MLRLRQPLGFILRNCGVLHQNAGLSSAANIPTPWFVDPEYMERRQVPRHLTSPSTLRQERPLPPDLPPCITNLYSDLMRSPHLETGVLEVCAPPATEPGPPLPSSFPKGRRQRGRTEFGLGIPDHGKGLWKWVVVAQVKEGTENRGGIESVMRVVRKTLLKSEPPVILPPNKKRRMQDGWGMVDAGEFAVHVLSRTAREKYFPNNSEGRRWQW